MSKVIPHIIEKHAEEASFLWILRDAAVHGPHYKLYELARLDQRVEAHLDGLRIAGEEGWAIAKGELRWREPGEIFVGASLALEKGDPDRTREMVELGTSEPELVRGLVSAFGWSQYDKVRTQIETLLESDRAINRQVGIAASAIHRKDPGDALVAAITDADPGLRARALQAVGELGRTDLFSKMFPAIADPDDACRFAAASSLTLHRNEQAALDVLKSFAESSGPFTRTAAAAWLRRNRLPEANAWRDALPPERVLLSIICAGAVGDPIAVPWLIERMNEPTLARRAGEALTMITGVDIEYIDLDGDEPKGFQAGPTENPEEEDVSMDPDLKLPWPDPGKISGWWKENSASFKPGVRHLLGKPVSPESAREALQSGRQRQRAAAAIELVIQEPGNPLFEVRAAGFRQG